MKKPSVSVLTMIAGLLLLAPRVGPAPVFGQTCGPVNCTGSPGSGINCTVMIDGTGCGGTAFVGPPMSMSAVCMFSGITATAVHNPSSGAASPSCIFSFVFGMSAPLAPNGSVNPCSPAHAGVCTITMAHGLPVELMEFSVEPEESAEGEAEDPETDDG